MDRKELVKVLGKHLDIKPKYLGIPSFAYQIGDFTVDREGKIKDKEGDEVELAEILNPNEATTIEIAFPLEGHNGVTLRNLVNMFYSRQDLIKKALGIEENIVEEDFINALNNSDIETIDNLIKILEDVGRESCRGIDFEEDKLIFNFVKELVASTEFLSLLNKKSKELKYASAKPINTDNEKYTFRTWLMRLGMIGDEYKATRKVLLQNLTGNTAFRKSGENHEA